MASRRKIPCAVFRLPIVDGKDEAILCEGSCQQWYHCGCASLPPERYKLSSTDESFYCLTCTCIAFKKMSELSSTVKSASITIKQLQSEVEALKTELATTKTTLSNLQNDRLQNQYRAMRRLLHPAARSNGSEGHPALSRPPLARTRRLPVKLVVLALAHKPVLVLVPWLQLTSGSRG